VNTQIGALSKHHIAKNSCFYLQCTCNGIVSKHKSRQTALVETLVCCYASLLCWHARSFDSERINFQCWSNQMQYCTIHLSLGPLIAVVFYFDTVVRNVMSAQARKFKW